MMCHTGTMEERLPVLSFSERAAFPFYSAAIRRKLQTGVVISDSAVVNTTQRTAASSFL